MTAADRNRLKAMVDAGRRAQIAAHKPPPCAGCGSRLDRYSEGCEACRSRRRGRSDRAREGRKRGLQRTKTGLQL